MIRRRRHKALLATIDILYNKSRSLASLVSLVLDKRRSIAKLWKKAKFGNEEMLNLVDIRLKICTYTSLLTLHINLLSMGLQGKVESFMESQGKKAIPAYDTR